jgi:hypothetical protein
VVLVQNYGTVARLEPRGGEEAIIFDPVSTARAALATAMRTKRISNFALAKTLGKSDGAIRRSPGRA